MCLILEAIQHTISRHSNEPFYIGLSGGIDSSVLLHACVSLQKPVIAIHVNHGLNPRALEWEADCLARSEHLGVPCLVERVTTQPAPGDSIEAWAREVRYQAFLKHVPLGGSLLLGQHLEDQAETLLLQLLRGAGPAGLAAMGQEKDWACRRILRPFLGVSREQIHAYAIAHKLSWVHDDSNDSLRFKRNLIRHEILPVLKRYFPDYLKPLARSAAICAETQAVLDEYLADSLNSVLDQDGNLELGSLKSYGPMQQKMLIKTWLKSRGVPSIYASHLDEFFKMINARGGARPVFQWHGFVVTREKGKLKVRQAL
ncbi:MAG: tRNA lysidine(34) synthetase TilS [Gammaproteobacteria bacterium]|nr:tRNA lysidine(34) synthetase TilS [Gammaproteobacteria bacterium]